MGFTLLKIHKQAARIYSYVYVYLVIRLAVVQTLWNVTKNSWLCPRARHSVRSFWLAVLNAARKTADDMGWTLSCSMATHTVCRYVLGFSLPRLIMVYILGIFLNCLCQYAPIYIYFRLPCVSCVRKEYDSGSTVLLCCFKLCTSFRIHWWIQTKVTVSPKTPNLGHNWQLFKPCDLGIWRMTLQNNRAPFLSNTKLCASFHHHMWIQTGVTVRKRLNEVLITVTLTFDLWHWPFVRTSPLSLVITPKNFTMIR